MNTMLLVDDHLLFREGLINIISRWDDFTVIGEASSGLEAIDLARHLKPDVILMDVGMRGMSGIEAAKQISKDLPYVRIVILTMSENEGDLFEAIKNGAHGYILKDTPSKRLHDQLRGVMRGESPLSGTVATKVLGKLTQPGQVSRGPLIDQLSHRELQVLDLIADGKTNAQIAEALYLSSNTIKKYVHNILAKLQLSNRVEAALYVRREN